MRRTTGAIALVAAVVLTGVAGCSDGDSASDADSGLVATDDEVVLYGGARGSLDLLANDTGPAEATIRVCKLPPGRDGRLHYQYYDVAKHLSLSAMPQAKAADHRIEYTACAGDERATATVLVTVLARPAITVTKASRPGRLRVTNPADVPITVSYGHPYVEVGLDGQLRVRAGESRVFRVRRDTIGWSASSLPESEPDFWLDGQVDGIRLPPGVEPLPDPGPQGST